MHIFNDNQGREWQVAINVAAVKRVRDILKVDLLTVLDDDGKLITQMSDDAVFLVDLIYILCREQAMAAGVTDEDFGRAMAGEAIDAAATAVLEELTAFFGPSRGILLAKALERLTALKKRTNEWRLQKLASPEIDERLDAAMEAAWQEALGRPSGAVPGSSA